MGSLYLILGLICSLLVAIIALANNDTVTVSYIFGRADLPLILLIFGSACVGALIMGLFSIFRAIRSAFAFRESRRRQEALRKQVKQLEEELLFLRAWLSRHTSNYGEDEAEPEADIAETGPDEPAVPGYKVETVLESEIDEDR